jgi:hypothetical protein
MFIKIAIRTLVPASDARRLEQERYQIVNALLSRASGECRTEARHPDRLLRHAARHHRRQPIIESESYQVLRASERGEHARERACGVYREFLPIAQPPDERIPCPNVVLDEAPDQGFGWLVAKD